MALPRNPVRASSEAQALLYFVLPLVALLPRRASGVSSAEVGAEVREVTISPSGALLRTEPVTPGLWSPGSLPLGGSPGSRRAIRALNEMKEEAAAKQRHRHDAFAASAPARPAANTPTQTPPAAAILPTVGHALARQLEPLLGRPSSSKSTEAVGPAASEPFNGFGEAPAVPGQRPYVPAAIAAHSDPRQAAEVIAAASPDKLVKVAETKRRAGARIDPELNQTQKSGETNEQEDMMKLGEGVGSMTYDRTPTESRKLNHELRRRLEVQDYATIAVIVIAFASTVLVSCLSVYQVAEDPSPVSFYSDPKFFRQRLLCASADAEAFLQAFNTQPQVARLRLVGRSAPRPSLRALLCSGQIQEFLEQLRVRIYAWCCPSRNLATRPPWDTVLFDVSLDLTPFLAQNGTLRSDADAQALEKHLRSSNALELLVLHKTVHWNHWEDVATNVRQRFRALGFQGEVDVHLEASEEVVVYRNHPWQNFVRSRITQAIVIFSLVGIFFWIPYLCVRMRRVKVETRFHMSLDLARYWELLSEGLSATDGFREVPAN